MTIEVPKTMPDKYMQEHPIESDTLITSKIEEFDTELAKIPDDDVKKAAYLQALEKCPDLVSSQKEKLKFLRCEVFNADVSKEHGGHCCFLKKDMVHKTATKCCPSWRNVTSSFLLLRSISYIIACSDSYGRLLEQTFRGIRTGTSLFTIDIV